MKTIDQLQDNVMQSFKGSGVSLEVARNICLSLAYSIQEELTPSETADQLHFAVDELAEIREEFT